MSELEKSEPLVEGPKLAIRHCFPEGQRTLFANHIIAQRTDDGEFTVSFFDIAKPVILSPEDFASAGDIKFVDAHCIARLAISEKRMPKFINALIEIYEAHQAAVSSTEQGIQEENKHAG